MEKVMKIAILGATNIKHMSLLSHYLQTIDLNKNVVDIIYTDKYGIDEKLKGINKYHKFNVQISNKMNFVRKAIEYLKFKPFAERIIKDEQYDFIIVWGSYTAHLFKGLLIKKYKEKYIVNIRDYFFEKNKIIKYRMKKVVDNSFLTTLSSEGFLKFLPKSSQKYQVVFSVNKSIIENSKKNSNFNFKIPIRIGFIGNVRFFEMNKLLMESLRNDSRYILQFFGTGSEILEEYALNQGIKNVECKPAFSINETSELLDQVDVINNIYGNNSMALDNALSIRMYYSLYLRKPLLTSPNTLTSNEAKKFGLSFDVDEGRYEDLGNQLEKWINKLNFDEIDLKCSHYIEKIDKSNNEFYQIINGRFNNEDIQLVNTNR